MISKQILLILAYEREAFFSVLQTDKTNRVVINTEIPTAKTSSIGAKTGKFSFAPKSSSVQTSEIDQADGLNFSEERPIRTEGTQIQGQLEK